MTNIVFTTLLEHQENHLNSWKQILELEKINYLSSVGKYTKLVITNDFKERKNELLNFVDNGGVCIIEQPDSIEELQIYKDEEILLTKINFPEFAISNAKYPTVGFSYKGIYNSKETIGYFNIFEDRVTKLNIENSIKPIFIKKVYGKGIFYLSTIDFHNFLNINGNTLRNIKSRFSTTEVTERISQLDKDLIFFSLTKILKGIFKELSIPWVTFSYFPEKQSSLFLMRIDVDGSEPQIIKNISELGVKYDIPITFYLNKRLVESNNTVLSEIKQIDSLHDIENHGDVHNVYDAYNENLLNIQTCHYWIKDNFNIQPTGFVAPRGIWNSSLEEALVEMGYDYSSDFGFIINGLPFRPYIDNEKSKILQVPVNPYNVGRAEIYFNSQTDYLRDEEILEYYYTYFNDVLSENGSGLIHIFGHPHGLGKRIKVLESIFKFIRNNDIYATTIRKFVNWWKYRENSNYELNYKNNQYSIQFKNNPVNFFIDESK